MFFLFLINIKHMKKVLRNMIFIFLIIPIITMGQEKDQVAIDSNSFSGNHMFAISPVKMNVLYSGVDNPVVIAVCGVNCKDITMTIDSGTITRQSDGWIVRVKNNTRKAVLTVYAGEGGKKVCFGSETFRIKRIPDPILTLSGVKSESIAKNLILAYPWLTTELPVGFDFDIRFKVASFTCMITQGKNTGKEFKCSGNKISAEAITAIENAAKGDLLSFYEVNIEGPDGIKRILNSLNYIIK
jgi:gliding motility-associated protein GldM